jgi:hypothetical protein
MDPRIADYIRANRDRYTREAIRDQLIAAGHAPADVDRAWEELSRPESGWEMPNAASARAPSGGLAVYVYLIYLVGLLAAVALAIAFFSSSQRGYAVVFLVVYAVIGLLAARWLAGSAQPQSGVGWASMLIGVPIIFLLLFGGSCLAGILGLGIQ